MNSSRVDCPHGLSRFAAVISLLTPYLISVILSFGAVDSWADYRATPQGKLEAAKRYADEFLKEDSRPDQLFFHRDVKFPTWKDQPTSDCGTKAIVRGIKTDAPYFEDKKQSVVIVPVLAELIMIEVHPNAGYPYGTDQSGQVQCRFEYERYSFETKRFERLPDFLTTPLQPQFLRWGTPYPETSDKYGSTRVVIAPDMRYVRFKFRINVARAAPYQTYPQFPRHHPLEAAIQRYEGISMETAELIEQRISDRNPSAVGDELDRDMERMRYQFKQRQWVIQQLRESLQHLRAIPTFSDIATQ